MMMNVEINQQQLIKQLQSFSCFIRFSNTALMLLQKQTCCVQHLTVTYTCFTSHHYDDYHLHFFQRRLSANKLNLITFALLSSSNKHGVFDKQSQKSSTEPQRFFAEGIEIKISVEASEAYRLRNYKGMSESRCKLQRCAREHSSRSMQRSLRHLMWLETYLVARIQYSPDSKDNILLKTEI